MGGDRLPLVARLQREFGSAKPGVQRNPDQPGLSLVQIVRLRQFGVLGWDDISFMLRCFRNFISDWFTVMRISQVENWQAS